MIHGMEMDTTNRTQEEPAMACAFRASPPKQHSGRWSTRGSVGWKCLTCRYSRQQGMVREAPLQFRMILPPSWLGRRFQFLSSWMFFSCLQRVPEPPASTAPVMAFVPLALRRPTTLSFPSKTVLELRWLCTSCATFYTQGRGFFRSTAQPSCFSCQPVTLLEVSATGNIKSG